MQNTVAFAVETKDFEGREYVGKFEVRTKVSRRDAIRQDEIRRGILGTNPHEASAYAQSIAEVVAYLKIRVMTAPKWWTESDGGLELEDDEVLVAVNNAAVKAVEAELAKFRKDADAAKAELRAELPKE